MAESVILSVMLYLAMACYWNFFFIYRVSMKIEKKDNVNPEKTINRNLDGFILTFACLFWIIVIPMAIKGTKKNTNKEE